MDITDFIEKKKKLEEAEKKVKEYKDLLKEERRKKFKENFGKINIFKKIKPWIIWNSILTVLVLIMFITAYTNNPSPQISESNKVGGFLSNVFSFLSKGDNTSSNTLSDSQNTEINSQINLTQTSNTTQDQESSDETSNTTQDQETSNEEGPTIKIIDFDIWAEYNENEFGRLETSSNIILYYAMVKNNENFDIKCDEEDYRGNTKVSSSNIIVKADEDRSIFIRVLESNAVNNMVLMKHKFICYDVEDSAEEGTVKQITVTIEFV